MVEKTPDTKKEEQNNKSSKKLGFKLYWSNKGIDEIGIDRTSNKTIIKISKKYFTA